MTTDKNKDRIYELTKQRNEYMQQGKTLEEVKVLKELAELTEKVYGEESNENIQILNELGGTLKYTGEFETAVNAIIKAKRIIEKNYGKEIVPYATCNLNLAEVYRFMKKFDEIEELYLETMEIYRMPLICIRKVWKYWKIYLNINFSMLQPLAIWYFPI